MRKACVLTGEGAKGSWQAAVLWAERQRYDMMVGVSSGAINAAGYAILGPAIVELWRKIDGFGAVFSFNWRFLWDSGFCHPGPLLKLLKANLVGKPFMCEVIFPTIDCESGEVDFHHFASGKVCTDDDVMLIAAAGAIPGLVTSINGRVDGGMRTLCPLQLPIDMLADQIDVIMAGAPFQPPTWPKQDKFMLFKATRMSIGAVETMLWEIMVSDIETALDCNAEDGKRVVSIRCVYPEKRIGWVLGFSHCAEMAELERYRPLSITLR